MNAFNYKEMQIRARVFLVLLQVLAEEGVGGGEGCNNNLACMITITFQSTEKGNWTVFNFFFSITTLLCSYGKSEKWQHLFFPLIFIVGILFFKNVTNDINWDIMLYEMFFIAIFKVALGVSPHFFFHLNQSTKSKLICWN